MPRADAELAGPARRTRLGALARRAVRQSARLSALPLEDLRQDAAGAPVAQQGTHWSLSHKPDRVAGIVARVPVGIDLETVRCVAAGMYAKAGADGEWCMLGGRHPEAFFRLWTAKEAALKAAGEGLRGLGACRLVRCNADGLELLHRGTMWTVRQCRRGDHLVAVAAGIDFRVAWRFPSQSAVLPEKSDSSSASDVVPGCLNRPREA